MATKRENPIPESKIKTVKELSNLMKNKKTILIASIKDLPASQFQEISKKLRGKAIVKVPKKNLIFRAIDETKNPELEKLKNYIKDSFALLFSDLDNFTLAGDLLKSKTPAKAKAGQEAPFDIQVDEGPTDLVPGPAISELGALGIQIQIKDGKIEIKEPKVIVKAGKSIPENAAAMMAKLDIKPFSIGFIPLSGFDTQENKLYEEIKIDTEGTLKTLKDAYARSLGFAVGIGYISKDTVRIMIAKAGAHANKLNRIFTGEPEVAPEEEKKEEPAKEEPKKEEAPKESAAGLGALFG